MKVDIYTKVILTIIAAALTSIAIRGADVVRPAFAQSSCGQIINPCYVEVLDGSVRVKSIEFPISGVPVQVMR